MPAEVAARLAPLAASDVRELAGGASSLTYRATVRGRQVVVKVAPPGLAPTLNRDVLRQARALRALHAVGVAVPQVIWEDPGDPPAEPPLYVMEYVEGSSYEPLFDAGSTEHASVVADRLRDAAAVLGRLHAVEPVAIGLGDEPVGTIAEEIARWSRLLDTVDPALAPGWETAAARLRASAPSSIERPALVHGDFRLGNLLATGGRIAAIIDWELWSVGDPRVDLGWFLANADPATYRRSTPYAGSVPPLAELIDRYERARGRPVSDVTWFQALACFKSTATWALIVKHNRRRPRPEAEVEALAGWLPSLLERANVLLDGC